MNKKIWLNFGLLALISSPIITTISCSTSKEIEKQLDKIDNEKQSNFTTKGLQEKISNIAQNGEVSTATLGINETEIEGYNVKYYLGDKSLISTNGYLEVKAEVSEKKNEEIKASKNIKINPNTNDKEIPTVRFPNMIENESITWNNKAGKMLIKPGINLEANKVQEAFNASDNSGENIAINISWTKDGQTWTGNNFNEEGKYVGKIIAQDSSNNKNEYTLTIYVSTIREELDKFNSTITSTKTKDTLTRDLKNLKANDPVSFAQVGIPEPSSDNFEHTLKIKEPWNSETAKGKLTLTVSLKNQPQVESFSKDIELVPYVDKILDEYMAKFNALDNSVSTKKASDLAQLSGVIISWGYLGIVPPTPEAAIISKEVRVISNQINENNKLIYQVTMEKDDNIAVKTLTVLGNLPPTFTLDTTTKLGGDNKETVASKTSEGGEITFAYNSTFTKKQIEDLVIAKDDLDQNVTIVSKAWKKGADDVTGELDNTPTTDTTYTLTMVVKDKLDQQATFVFTVLVQASKLPKPKAPTFKDNPIFGNGLIPIKNDSSYTLWGNAKNISDMPKTKEEVESSIKNNVNNLRPEETLDISWTKEFNPAQDGTYTVIIKAKNADEVTSDTLLILVIEIDTQLPDISWSTSIRKYANVPVVIKDNKATVTFNNSNISNLPVSEADKKEEMKNILVSEKDTTFDFEFKAEDNNKKFTITAFAVDKAGNKSTKSLILEIIIEDN